MHRNLRNKDIYQYFRMGLVTGLVEKDAVVAWADRVLAREPAPDFEIIELSLSGKLPYSQLVHILSRMQGEADYSYSLKLLLARAEMLLCEKPEGAVEFILGLRLLNAETFLPAAIRSELVDLDRLNEQYRTNRVSYEDLSARLAAFLEPYAHFRCWLDDLQA